MPNRDIVCGSLRSISTFFPDIFPIIPHCSDSPSHPMVIDSDSLLGSEAIFFSFINSPLISSFSQKRKTNMGMFLVKVFTEGKKVVGKSFLSKKSFKLYLLKNTHQFLFVQFLSMLLVSPHLPVKIEIFIKRG
ncbi:hypothetical protein ES705_10299 [subsurface metagenome]